MDIFGYSKHFRQTYLTCAICLVVITIVLVLLFEFTTDLKLYRPSVTYVKEVYTKEPNRTSSYISKKQVLNPDKVFHSDRSKTSDLQRLGDLVQRRLNYLQNPKHCDRKKKILCNFTAGIGYGSQTTDWIFCLIVAYATQRTLIIDSRGWNYAKHGRETLFLPLSTNCTTTKNQTIMKRRDLGHVENIPVLYLSRIYHIPRFPNYLPLSIPEDLADELTILHKNPSGWWIGQFLVYLTRPNQHFKSFQEQSITTSGFEHPIVGIHVRRTDKYKEARLHTLEEYMSHVKIWFDNYEKKHRVVQRRVYLATDDKNVLFKARGRFPNYTFLSTFNSSAESYSESALRMIVVDIQMLSMCDFVVCTLSSNVGRMVYMLMHVRYWDAPDRIYSLDIDFSFHVGFASKKGIEMLRKGLFPKRYKELKDKSRNPIVGRISGDNRAQRVKMPTYSEVKL